MFLKKYIVSVLLLVLATSLYGAEFPISKGASILGGQASFSKYSGDLYGNPDSYYVINLDFNYQKFVSQGVAVGFDFVYDLESEDNNSQYTVAIGPVLSYFSGAGMEKYFPFIQGSIVVGKIHSQGYGTIVPEQDRTLIRPGVILGVVYLMAEHFGISGGLKYSLNVTRDDNGQSLKESRLGLQIGLNLLWY